ncbi:Flp pilus assembly protein TadG [Streptacidiphilus sp. MAP12-16]
MPALVLFLLIVIAAGRVETAKGTVDAAARDAARSASLARTPDAARQAASDAAAKSLVEGGVSCQNLSQPVVDTNDFAPQPGVTGSVTVTVSCTVLLSDLAVRGLPGSVTLSSVFTSVVDRYRTR